MVREAVLSQENIIFKMGVLKVVWLHLGGRGGAFGAAGVGERCGFFLNLESESMVFDWSGQRVRRRLRASVSWWWPGLDWMRGDLPNTDREHGREISRDRLSVGQPVPWNYEMFVAKTTRE